MSDDFFIGYHASVPAGHRRAIRRTVFGFGLASVIFAALFVLGLSVLSPAYYEFGQSRTFTGTIQLKPYPHLLVKRPGLAGEESRLSSYVLAGPLKSGADAYVRDFEGEFVQLEGTLIYRSEQTLVEIIPGTIQNLRQSADQIPAVAESKTVSLVGEIVDSKCFYGVMNPGSKKVHRACAVRCISGGMPPFFITRADDGSMRASYLLVDSNGNAVNDRVLPIVGVPVAIDGVAERRGDLWLLRADPDQYRVAHSGLRLSDLELCSAPGSVRSLH